MCTQGVSICFKKGANLDETISMDLYLVYYFLLISSEELQVSIPFSQKQKVVTYSFHMIHSLLYLMQLFKL